MNRNKIKETKHLSEMVHRKIKPLNLRDSKSHLSKIFRQKPDQTVYTQIRSLPKIGQCLHLHPS